MTEKKKKRKKIGKVNPLLYAIVYSLLKRKYTKKYGIKFDKSIVRDIKGPAIILATHTSDEDHILSALNLYPIRPTYVVSEHFIHNKKTAGLLKLMHVITKRMFTTDIATIINIMRARAEKAVIVIFPEGRLSYYGHTLPLAEGTAELIKKLGVDLYAWKAKGAYLTFPKWRDKGDGRQGEIHTSLTKLLSKDEVALKEVSEIKKIAEEAILHDDELSMQGIEYRCEDIARGLDKILYKCPSCLSEGNIHTGEGHLRCDCGFDALLDSSYRLHGAPFERINDWVLWQQNSIDTDNERLSSRAKFGACGKDGFIDPSAGEGEIYLDKDAFRLSGSIFGERVEFEVSPEKIGAFPMTPGDHFDVYHAGRLIYVYPVPNPNVTVKWVAFLDSLMQKKKSESLA